MTTFTYRTFNETYDGDDDNDVFDIIGPTDTDFIYTVISNGNGGDDRLFFSNGNPVNIIFNAGEGRDMARVFVGDVDTNFDFDMGIGDDLVIIGEGISGAQGNFDITLGEGQDDLILFDVRAEIIITDFETGSQGDRFVFSDLLTISSLAAGANPFSDGTFSLAALAMIASSITARMTAASASINAMKFATGTTATLLLCLTLMPT